MLIEILQTDFRFEDERGDLTQLVHDGYKQINVITTRKGVLRGGHYHRLNREAFYIISGKVEFTAYKDGETEQRTFGRGDFFGIGPNIVHDFAFLDDTLLVSMYDSGVEFPDGTKDIISRYN